MKSNQLNVHRVRRLCLLVTIACMVLSVKAGELIYVPVNPAFGGNPNNGPVLLSAAQAQNRTKEKLPASATAEKSELQKFNEMVERSVMSRMASAVTGGVMGLNGQLVPGTVQTQSFTIEITDAGSGVLRVTTTDKNTHESTTFEVGK